jgi:hypothetical protein
LIEGAKLKTLLTFNIRLREFIKEFEKLLFLEKLSEDLIFDTYSSTLKHAGECEFSQFDEFTKESFFRLKFRSIESRI